MIIIARPRIVPRGRALFQIALFGPRPAVLFSHKYRLHVLQIAQSLILARFDRPHVPQPPLKVDVLFK